MMVRLLLMLLLTLGAASVVRAAPPPTGDAAEHRILVMLRLAPDHFRAGSDYQGGYGNDQSKGGRHRMAAAIANRNGLILIGDWPMPVIGIDCFIMQVPADRTIEAAAADVARDAGVEWAQPVLAYRTLEAMSGDPLFSAQPTARVWRLAALHRVATGRRVRIAVIDSAVDVAHPDLSGQIEIARDFTDVPAAHPEDHGTGVAGVIAARRDNGLGIVGVAPDARLLALRACRQLRATTVCDTLSLAKAIAFAIERRADILNLSLSGPPDRLIATLLHAALADHRQIVAAHDDRDPAGGFPASVAGVIAVAANPVGGQHGPYWAPGTDIPTTRPGGRWSMVSGSSYAAAEVSGLLALARQRHDEVGDPMMLVSSRSGGGEIDGCATLLRDRSRCATPGSSLAAVVVPPPR